MEKPLQTGYLFSPSPIKERALRRLYWSFMAFLLLLLFLFWTPLRSTRFTYSLVSLTIGSLPLEIFFRLVTTLGSEGFFLVFFAIIYWFIDPSLGFWGLFLMPLSIFITSELPKDIIRLPRPEVRGVSVPTYTFPSGHTSGSVCVWGYLGIMLQKPWIWKGVGLIILLVGLSRIMLGYHYPGDVLGGIVAGMLFLLLFFSLGRGAMAGDLKNVSPPLLLLLFLVLPFSLSLLPVTFGPRLMGYLTGAGVGYVLAQRLEKKEGGDLLGTYIQKGMLGLTGLVLITLGLDSIIPSNMHGLIYLQYALATFWITYLAPLLFLSRWWRAQ